MPETIHRNAVRAAIVTPGGEILLMRVVDPANGFEVWFTPGGGIEPGECAEDCVRRELREETGLLTPAIGPAIWTRRHLFDWNGKQIDQTETFHLVTAECFEPVITDRAGSEWGDFREFRWWSADEIEASRAVFAPRRLAEVLRSLLSDGPPRVPFDVGV